MNYVLWAVQVVLAAVFLMAGGFKATTEAAVLAEQMPLLPLGFLRFLGAAEIAGAVGLLLPSALRIAPWLTPAAAVGLAFTMVSAVVFHGAIEGNVSGVPFNVLLLGLSLFVAWGRGRPHAIAPRGTAGRVAPA